MNYIKAVQARKLGAEYESRSGYPWQYYALTMSDGTERHTAVPAGPRAAAEALRAIEEAEHPAFADKFGRLWTWWKGDLWHHDNTLAMPRDLVERLAGSLPPERLRSNPNYWKLCETCRSQWADTSPVSPRVRLSEGWFDVRDGQFYGERDEDQAAIDRWEADGGA